MADGPNEETFTP